MRESFFIRPERSNERQRTRGVGTQSTLAPGAHLPWRAVPGSAGEGGFLLSVLAHYFDRLSTSLAMGTALLCWQWLHCSCFPVWTRQRVHPLNLHIAARDLLCVKIIQLQRLLQHKQVSRSLCRKI